MWPKQNLQGAMLQRIPQRDGLLLLCFFFVSLVMLSAANDVLECHYFTEGRHPISRRSATDENGFPKEGFALLTASRTQTGEEDDYDTTPRHYGRKFTDENGLQKEECLGNMVCYVAWKVVRINATNATEDYVMKGGCFPKNPQRDEKGNPQCSARCEHRDAPKMYNTRFCCCTENNCNVNFTDIYVPEATTARTTTTTASAHPNNITWIWIIVALLSASVVVLLATVVVLCVRRRMDAQKAAKCSEELKPLNLSETFPQRFNGEKEAIDLRMAKLDDELASGRYGTVHRAIIEGRVVAIKIFREENYAYFLNECRIYNLPHMQEHDSILKFLAATEQFSGNQRQYWLVLDYHPNKSLIEFLKANTIDARTFTGMAHSLASGLAFLHSDITRDGTTKPGIGHRDFNSRNILVRSDFRLCICDMGFALPLNARDVSWSSSSDAGPVLNDVGTIRYMAPEILEGSLNLRDSSTALRQVDMYAFALSFWEMATRCSDLYKLAPVPEYKLPFQKEAGMHPTFADMTNLVARKKARPLFPDAWKDNNLSVKFLKEIMEECWDADAEARLTANCVEQRLTDMAVVFEKQKSTVINIAPTDRRLSVAPSVRSDTEEATEMSPMLESLNETIVPPTKNINEMMDVMNKNALNSLGYPAMGRIQPHQGRNPCHERNYKVESSDELTTSGNNLVSKKSGFRQQSPPAASHALMSRGRNATAASSTAAGASNVPAARQKKVSNDTAAHLNLMSLGGLFNFRGRDKDKQTLSTLLGHRAAPAAVPAPATSPSGPSSSTPAIYIGGNKKNNLSTAAAILPHLARRETPGDASTSTQLTCLSPSPSTTSSGASPPQYSNPQSRIPRFSMIHDNSETDQSGLLENSGDDEGLGRSPRETLINIDSAGGSGSRD